MSEANLSKKRIEKKRRGPLLVLGSVFIIGLLVFLYWLFWARFSVSTNDAYIHGNTIEIFPQINGTISAIHAQETSHVQAGDILVELDPTDALIAFEKSKSHLASTVREVMQMFDRVYQLKAQVEMQQIQLNQAELNYSHREALVQIGGVTQEDFETSRTEVWVAQAALNQSIEDLRGSQAQIYHTSVPTHPKVKEAIDQVRSAWINLQRTLIRAPVEGYIALRSAQVGEAACLSSPLLSLVPLDELWVNANFKEVQLRKIRIGQSVSMITSLYGNQVKYRGTVLGISPGTGSVFSVLPPQNATGNWIKIMQRVPVRISLEPRQIKKYPLRLGLSLKAKVDLIEENLEPLSSNASSGPIYQTPIFQEQMRGVDEVIRQIIGENMQTPTGYS